MLENIMADIQRHILPLSGFENAKILEIWPGHAKLSYDITNDSLNLYGNMHGGFIYTLCDMAAGMSTHAYEFESVTQQGSIHYIKTVKQGTVFIESNAIHKGRKTVINQVNIKNEQGNLIASCTFTMFLLKPLESLPSI